MVSAWSATGWSPFSKSILGSCARASGAAHARPATVATNAMHAIGAAAPRRTPSPSARRAEADASRGVPRRSNAGRVETAGESLEIGHQQGVVDQLRQLAVEEVVQRALRLQHREAGVVGQLAQAGRAARALALAFRRPG